MSRHKSLATAMSALLAYRNRPEGEPVPVKTNWSLTPSNDNEPEVVAEMGYERIHLITPSVKVIMEQVATGEVVRDDSGAIVSIGRLRFSDGEQVERGHKIGPDGGAVGTELRMPAGAMLGCVERQQRTMGGDENPSEVTASNNYFADMFGLPKPSVRPASKKLKRNGMGFTRTKAKAMLAEAYANTPVLPPVTKCPLGLPAAGTKIADSFVGMKKAGRGDTGSSAWESIASALVDREIWAEALAELSDKDRQTLDAVAHGRARTYEEVGVMLGQSVNYARNDGGGRKALQRANDNLQHKLKYFVA